MYTLIFGGVGLLLALIFVGVGALKGRKQHRTYSWMRLAATALALVLSVLLSSVLARTLSSFAMKLFNKSGLAGDFGEMLKEAPVLSEVICALMAMILAPMLFYWMFLIAKGILNFIVRRVARSVILKAKKAEANEPEDVKTTKTSETIEVGNVTIIDTVTVSEGTVKVKKEKKFAVLHTKKADGIGALCGALCGLLIFFAFMVPLMGTVAVADSAMGAVSSLAGNETVNTITTITDAAANNVGAKVYRKAGGDLAFELLTTQKIEKESVCLVKEINFLTGAAETIATVTDGQTTPKQAEEALLEMERDFEKTTMIPTLAPSLLTSANEQWDQGRSFMGVQKPLATNPTADAIVDPLLHGFAEADPDTVREDVKTVIEIMAILAGHDALNQVKAAPSDLVADEELTSSLLLELFENKHMCSMLGAISDGGLSMAGSKLGLDMSRIHLHLQQIDDPESEAASFAHALHCAMELFRKMSEGGAFDADMIRMMGPIMDAFSQSALIGEDNTAELLKTMLASSKVTDTLGFSADETDAIVSVMIENTSEGGFTSMMDTVGQSLEVVQLATQVTKDPTVLDQKVGELITTMTPASAEVLKAVTTPSLMVNKGVPEHSAEATSDMLTAMFDNLSVAKEAGLSEEDYQKEAAATTNMLNMAMAAKASGSKELFGEGSATGKSADDFVDEIFSSDIISQTMIETVYTESESGEPGEPTVNPLNTKRALKENEKTDILAALNKQWENASEEQRADEEYQKQYVAMGAIMNLPIEFTEGGIVDAASLAGQLPSNSSVTE